MNSNEAFRLMPWFWGELKLCVSGVMGDDLPTEVSPHE